MNKPITKKEFIDRFKHIPDDALILCIPVRDSPIPDIAGAWMEENGELKVSMADNWAYVEPMTSNSIIRHFMKAEETQP